MLTIFVGGDLERAIRQLREEFQKSGIEREIRRRRYFMKPSEIRRKEEREAIRRLLDMKRKISSG